MFRSRPCVPGRRYRLPMSRDAWGLYWQQVSNENYLAAKQLLELSPRVEGYFAAYARADRLGGHEVDWLRAGKDIDEVGMSTTERHLAHLAVGLIAGREDGLHLIDLATLASMGSWTDDVLRVLVKWASDGRLDVTGRFLADDPWIKAFTDPQG